MKGDMIKLLLKNECRNITNLIIPVFFFAMVNTLFPLTLEAGSQILSSLQAMMAWISLFLATLLIADSFFKEDYAAGVYQQWLLSEQGILRLILYKIGFKWALVILPMNLLTFLFALLYNTPFSEALLISLALLLGSPSILLISLLMSAASVNININSGLLAILALPISIPVLIFGASILSSEAPLSVIYMLLAILFLTLMSLPLAIAYLIRVSFE